MFLLETENEKNKEEYFALGLLRKSKIFNKYVGEADWEDILVITSYGKIIDIKLNKAAAIGTCLKRAGPIKRPCCICLTEVTEQSEGLKCSNCFQWFHNNCLLNPMLKPLYKLLGENDNIILIIFKFSVLHAWEEMK